MTPEPAVAIAKDVALLLVDDRKENLLSLEALLRPLGHELVRAQSGAEALKEIERHDFAVVLLDVRMPVMDGYEVAAAIRKGTRNQHVPILFLTADDRSDEIESAFALGAADYLQKPLNPTFLRGKIATFVALFRQKTQIEELLDKASQRASQAEGEAARLRDEEHDLLRAVVDDSTEGILVADHEGILRAVNAAALRQRGVAGLQVGADCKTLPVALRSLDGAELTFEQTPLARALAGTEVNDELFHATGPDGLTRTLSATASPLHARDGTPLGAVVTTRDETERLAMESELRERNELLALTAKVGVALGGHGTLQSVLQTCAEALVLHLDAAFARIWTLAPGADVLELQASAGMYTHLNGAHGRVAVGQFKIGEIAKERTPLLTNAVVGDPRVSDQPWARQEKIVAFVGYPLLLGDRILGVVAAFARHPFSPAVSAAMEAVADGLAQGIDRRQSEDRLRESEGWLSTTLTSIGDGVIATNANGIVTFLNPVASALTGWTTDEARGLSLDRVFQIVTEDEALVESPVERVIREGVAVAAPKRTLLVRRDGGHVPIEDSAAPIRDSDGRLRGVVFVFRDGSEQRRVEAERARMLEQALRSHQEAEAARQSAEEANAAKDRFFATVSHELRTPLSSILGWARMLRTRPELQTKGLDTIERNAKAQAQLIEDMFDSARIVAGKLNIEPTPFFVAEAIDGAIDSARPAATAKGITLEGDVDPEIGTLVADEGRFHQVISNLVANSLKFTPRDGRIRIVAARTNDELEIAVEDTGKGIEPEFLPHVFERFRQSDPAVGGGLGLGLAIVRAIVELHGGSVAVHSEGLGKGSRFSVRFPIQPAVRASDGTTGESSVVPRILVGVSILVVDDEQDARDVTVASLELAGAVVRSAASVDEALLALADWKPDAIVSDVGMPGKDGYAFLRELRTSPAFAAQRFPVIALTAFARGEDRKRALTAGFTSYISKPVDPNELAIVVASALGRDVVG